MDDVRADHTSNTRLIGYSDQGGRPDGVQIMERLLSARRAEPGGYRYADDDCSSTRSAPLPG